MNGVCDVHCLYSGNTHTRTHTYTGFQALKQSEYDPDAFTIEREKKKNLKRRQAEVNKKAELKCESCATVADANTSSPRDCYLQTERESKRVESEEIAQRKRGSETNSITHRVRAQQAENKEIEEKNKRQKRSAERIERI